MDFIVVDWKNIEFYQGVFFFDVENSGYLGMEALFLVDFSPLEVVFKVVLMFENLVFDVFFVLLVSAVSPKGMLILIISQEFILKKPHKRKLHIIPCQRLFSSNNLLANPAFKVQCNNPHILYHLYFAVVF